MSTESELRVKVVAQARSWLGCKESDGSHKKIIDVYNGHKPLAVGYVVKYTDAWCSTFASAVAIACGLTDIIPTECGCERHIQLFKKLGRWVENDAYVPKPGDYIFYDWSDTGIGDNTGAADHVGIVEVVNGNTITVIEGNISDSVGRRNIQVNGRYIRGYGVPDYASKATSVPTQQVEKSYTVGPSNEATVYNFCREVLGLSTAGAVGILANIRNESNFNPTALGDNGTSYGICQWHAGRFTALKDWCKQNGKDYTTLDAQLWYLKYELERSYSSVLSHVRSVSNSAAGAYDAAYHWCLKFEIPANTVKTSEQRGVLARDTYWPKYSTNASSQASVPSSTTEFSVGDLVNFVGNKHYVGANVTNGVSARPGPAKVTQVFKGGKHPYHVIHTDSTSNVYGWVDTNDLIKAFNLSVGDKVKMQVNAPVYGKSTKFSSFVYNSVLYVRQIDGDRIVVSTQKTGDITGAVDKKYLTLVG